MKIALAQMNPVVGDLDGNADRIAALARQAAEAGGNPFVGAGVGFFCSPPQGSAPPSGFSS